MDEEKEKAAQSDSGGAEITLEQIKQQCLDSPGYVLFVGCIGRNRDARGNNILNFSYRRSNFSFEDTKTAIKEFEKAYKNDVEDMNNGI